MVLFFSWTIPRPLRQSPCYRVANIPRSLSNLGPTSQTHAYTRSFARPDAMATARQKKRPLASTRAFLSYSIYGACQSPDTSYREYSHYQTHQRTHTPTHTHQRINFSNSFYFLKKVRIPDVVAQKWTPLWIYHLVEACFFFKPNSYQRGAFISLLYCQISLQIFFYKIIICIAQLIIRSNKHDFQYILIFTLTFYISH